MFDAKKDQNHTTQTCDIEQGFKMHISYIMSKFNIFLVLTNINGT